VVQNGKSGLYQLDSGFSIYCIDSDVPYRPSNFNGLRVVPRQGEQPEAASFSCLAHVGFTCKDVWHGPGTSQVRDKRLCQVEALVRLPAPDPQLVPIQTLQAAPAGRFSRDSFYLVVGQLECMAD
jgi:hypothetical protein